MAWGCAEGTAGQAHSWRTRTSTTLYEDLSVKRIFPAVIALVAVSGCGISTQQEVEMGQQTAAQVNAQLPMLNDPAIVGYVNQLGQSIASRTSRADLDWHFQVVNSSVVNAFALPGGFIYVNRGVLERATKMDEVAGVIAHEIEHVVRRHSVKQMEQVQGANVGVALACALTRVCESQAAQAGIQVAGAAVFAKFSRGDEIEADEGGFNNVIRAGINPEGMLTFFQKLLAEEKSNGNGNVLPWFQDHPGTEDRVADMQRMLNASSAQVRALPTNTTGFNQMKRRLDQLPAAPRSQ